MSSWLLLDSEWHSSRNIKRYPLASHRTRSYSGLVFTQICLHDFCLVHTEIANLRSCPHVFRFIPRDSEHRLTPGRSTCCWLNFEWQWTKYHSWQTRYLKLFSKITCLPLPCVWSWTKPHAWQAEVSSVVLKVRVRENLKIGKYKYIPLP